MLHLLYVTVSWHCQYNSTAVSWSLLLNNKNSVWLVGQQLIVCLDLEVTLNLDCCSQKCLPSGLPANTQHRFQDTIPATWLCISLYAVSGCILHPCFTMLSVLPHHPLSSAAGGPFLSWVGLFLMCSWFHALF